MERTVDLLLMSQRGVGVRDCSIVSSRKGLEAKIEEWLIRCLRKPGNEGAIAGVRPVLRCLGRSRNH